MGPSKGNVSVLFKMTHLQSLKFLRVIVERNSGKTCVLRVQELTNGIEKMQETEIPRNRHAFGIINESKSAY